MLGLKQLCLGVFALCGYALGEVPMLDNDYLGLDQQLARCSLMQKSKNKDDASIQFKIKRAESTGGSKFNGEKDDLKVPILVLPVHDLLNFTNVPTPDAYNEMSFEEGSRKQVYSSLVDFESKKFILKSEEGHSDINSNRIYNGYISTSGPNVVPISDSGFYCMYVAPPEDITKLGITLYYKNSYGYLTYEENFDYSTAKLCIFVGIVMAGLMVHHIITRVGKDFSGLDNLSMITWVVVFYILLPDIGIKIMNFVLLFFKNNFPKAGFFKSKMVFVLVEMGNMAYDYFLLLCVLLFAMGYGVIYCSEGSQKYRKFPPSQKKFAVVLFYCGVITSFVALILALMGFVLLAALSFGIASLVSLSMIVSSMYYYLKTKKTIAKFPPVRNSEDSTEFVDTLTRSFKRSMLIIYVLPFVFSFFFVVAMILETTSKSMNRFQDIDMGSRPDVTTFVLAYEVLQEQFLNSNTLAVLKNFTPYQRYIQILMVYFIWIRHNAGIVIKDAKEEFSDSPPVAQENSV